MKKKIKNIFKKYIIYMVILPLIIIIYSASIYNNKDKFIWHSDTLRHYKFSQLFDKYNYKEVYEKYNWWNTFKNAIYENYNTDLWQWHHLLIYWISRLWRQQTINQ